MIKKGEYLKQKHKQKTHANGVFLFLVTNKQKKQNIYNCMVNIAPKHAACSKTMAIKPTI